MKKAVVNDERPVNQAPPKVDKPLKAEPKKEEQVEINLNDDFNPF